MAERTDSDRTARHRADSDRAAGEFTAQTGYRPSTNQAREEPVPASHHEDHDQAAVLRNEELGRGHRPDGEPAEDDQPG